MTGPADRKRRQVPVASDPDRMAALNAELRETVREAHAALKDMERVLREYRENAATTMADIGEAAAQVAAAELRRYGEHLQAEMNAQAVNLNRAVDEARHHIVTQLTLAYIEPDPEVRGRLRFVFTGAPFDEDPTGTGPEHTPDPAALTVTPHDRGPRPEGGWDWPVVGEALAGLSGVERVAAGMMIILSSTPDPESDQPEETPEQ